VLSDRKSDLYNIPMVDDSELLVPKQKYLSAGIHVGSKMRTKDMSRFIYKIRSDGLSMLNIKKTDERIRIAAKFISRFPPEAVLAVSARIYGFRPVKKFSEYTGCRAITGRILPGVLTNPQAPLYIEPEVVLLSDPRVDKQIHDEAVKVGIPVVALVDADNTLEYIDLAIPTNNKGRRALAFIFWLLTREVLRARGSIPPDGELPEGYDSFATRIIGLK
jgi:small subunit ribosomal protein S2